MTRENVSSIWVEMMGYGVQERYYDVRGVRTRVWEAGAGPTLVMLHGTGGHAEAYYRNIGPLSASLHVCVVDMVGHGFSDRPELDYTIDDYANHLEGLLDVLGVERVHISGESLGGAVAAWFAITRPDRIERLILNTGMLVLPDHPEELLDVAKRTQAIMAGGLTREAVRSRMEWLVADPSRITDELVETRYRIYSQPGMMEATLRVMGRMMRLLTGEIDGQYVEPGVMADVSCPTLVLWSEHNPGQSSDLARQVTGEMPNARFELLSDCGHWPQYEAPAAFNQLHEQFLLDPVPAS
jgi:pimeloyl-ACP methyl ester carboxylesterase